MKDATRHAISHDGDYVPTDHDKRRNALRLVRQHIANACRDAVVADQLEQLDGIPVSTLSQEIYKIALLELLHLSKHAERVRITEGGDEVRTPDYMARNMALKTLAESRLREAELIVKMRELETPERAQGHVVTATVVTEEQLAELEALQRAEG